MMQWQPFAAIKMEQAGVEGDEAPLETKEAPSPESVGLFVVGSVVRVHGLQAGAAYNGLTGVCEFWHADRGRWMIRLNDAAGSEKNIALANLEFADAADPRIVVASPTQTAAKAAVTVKMEASAVAAQTADHNSGSFNDLRNCPATLAGILTPAREAAVTVKMEAGTVAEETADHNSGSFNDLRNRPATLAGIPTPAKSRWSAVAVKMEEESVGAVADGAHCMAMSGMETSPERLTPEKHRMPQYTGNAARANTVANTIEKPFTVTTPERQTALSRQLVAPTTRQLVAPRSWAFWSPGSAGGSPVRQRLRKGSARPARRSPKFSQKRKAGASPVVVEKVKSERIFEDFAQLAEQDFDAAELASPSRTLRGQSPSTAGLSRKRGRPSKHTQKKEANSPSTTDFFAVKRELANLKSKMESLTEGRAGKRKTAIRTPVRKAMSSATARIGASVSRRECEALLDRPELASIVVREQRSPSSSSEPSPCRRLTRAQLAAGQAKMLSPVPSNRSASTCAPKKDAHSPLERSAVKAADRLKAQLRTQLAAGKAPSANPEHIEPPSPEPSDGSSKRRRLTLTNEPLCDSAPGQCTQLGSRLDPLPAASNFDSVRHFHNAFGVASLPKPQLDVYEKNPKLMDSRLALLTEEVRGLQDAVARQNLHETVDALTDILYIAYGTGAALGVDLNSSFGIVHASNMSKLCRTEERAKATVAQYEEAWVNGTSEFETPAYRKASDGKHWVVYNESSGEILKCIDWSAPDFAPIGVPAIPKVRGPPRALGRQASSF